MYTDKTLVCKDCGQEFVFSAGEQEFYAERGFENEPQRCKACRAARKGAARPERVMYDAVCSECGAARPASNSWNCPSCNNSSVTNSNSRKYCSIRAIVRNALYS